MRNEHMTKKNVKQKEVKCHFLDNNREEGEKESVKREREREREREINCFFFFSSFLFKIHGNRTVGFF